MSVEKYTNWVEKEFLPSLKGFEIKNKDKHEDSMVGSVKEYEFNSDKFNGLIEFYFTQEQIHIGLWDVDNNTDLFDIWLEFSDVSEIDNKFAELENILVKGKSNLLLGK